MNKTSIVSTAFCCLLMIASRGTSYSQNPDLSPRKIVLFAVWPAEKGKKPDVPLLDPIAALNGKRFQKPPEYDYDKQKESDAEFNRFEKQYYKHGQQYPLLIHGSLEGNVTVEQPTSMTCMDQNATVKLSRPLPEDHMRIVATSLEGLGVHSDRDTAVTSEDRSNFVAAAATYLKHRGVANLTTSRIKVDRLYSVSLSVELPVALVGSVSARQKGGVHHLFLLAVKADQRYTAELASYHVTKDVLDYTDDVSENFVEHLDLDNDGFDELITISHYYESWDYAIYRKENGKWKSVYKGGGGGC